MKPVYFKYRDLVLLDACEQKERFKEVFGAKVLVTVTTAVVHAERFDWVWVADNILRDEMMAAFYDKTRGLPACGCIECDPTQTRSKRVAQAFVECYLAQGGTDYKFLAKRRRGEL